MKILAELLEIMHEADSNTVRGMIKRTQAAKIVKGFHLLIYLRAVSIPEALPI